MKHQTLNVGIVKNRFNYMSFCIFLFAALHFGACKKDKIEERKDAKIDRGVAKRFSKRRLTEFELRYLHRIDRNLFALLSSYADHEDKTSARRHSCFPFYEFRE